MKGDTVSRITLQNMLNRQTYKAPEKRALQDLLDMMEGDSIGKETAVANLKDSIVPLVTKEVSQYATYNSLYTPKDARTIIYQSPLIDY